MERNIPSVPVRRLYRSPESGLILTFPRTLPSEVMPFSIPNPFSFISLTLVYNLGWRFCGTIESRKKAVEESLPDSKKLSCKAGDRLLFLSNNAETPMQLRVPLDSYWTEQLCSSKLAGHSWFTSWLLACVRFTIGSTPTLDALLFREPTAQRE